MIPTGCNDVFWKEKFRYGAYISCISYVTQIIDQFYVSSSQNFLCISMCDQRAIII